MKEMSQKKQLTVNLISGIIAFGFNLIINFFLSPFIVKKLGVEANGFISLANNFITYASLITIALNSMASRFITIQYHQGDRNGAEKYYTAVFTGNIAAAILIFVPAAICIWKLEYLIQIPKNLMMDVKFLFLFIFLNFLVNTAFNVWNVATFVTNKLYLTSLRTMESYILRMGIIVLLFYFFVPTVSYIGIAALAATLFLTAFAYHYKKMLLPDIKYQYKIFDIKVVIELLCAGIWNSINQAGVILLNGLDLLITNIMINPVEMGILAVSKTIPTVIVSLSGTLANVFAPNLTISYARQDAGELKRELKQAIKISSIIVTIPIVILIAFGKPFYALWMPSLDANKLQILSILACFQLIITGGTQCLYNVFTVVNRLKPNAILVLLTGIFNTGIVIALLHFTDWGIYAVAGVSSVCSLIRQLFYTIPYSAKYLNMKWHTFFPDIGIMFCNVAVVSFIGLVIQNYFPVAGWITLLVNSVVTAAIGFIIGYFIILNKSERKAVAGMVRRKMLKKSV